MDSKELSW